MEPRNARGKTLNVVRHPTYLGTVQDVIGATVTVQLDDATASGLVFIDGTGYRVGQIGSFVRIPIGFVDLFGIVSQVGAGACTRDIGCDRTSRASVDEGPTDR